MIGTLVLLVFSVALMLLWNWVVPALFRGPTISFAQSAGLLVLTKLVVGSWQCHYSRGSKSLGWKQKFEQRWQAMSPEEQARLKRNFAHQCRAWRWSEPEPDTESESKKVNAGS